MQETDTLIVGASISGLACAACMQRHQLEYLIIEKTQQVATPWRNHYHRLHLHTNKRLSNLPFKKFGKNIPRYPTRTQVLDYLSDYQREFGITPMFNTEAISIRRENSDWITDTTNGSFKSKFVVMATGPFGKPKPVEFSGMNSFPGTIVHSYDYKTGSVFKGQRVLVVGFGNSACEIAIDLFEQGAYPSMAVRSAVNVIPRDILGVPVLELSLLMKRLSPRVSDKINAPMIRLLIGDITKLGLKKMPYGPLEQIRKDGKAPVLDLGTIEHIKRGNIRIHGDIGHIEGNHVHFEDGSVKVFDAIVAAIGFYRDYAEIVDVETDRFEDLQHSVKKQAFFGKDGLYFCGFWISPTGQIREIASDAALIARDIYQKIAVGKI